eukprot:m.183118 g.183118  ORF g.183118 m.183118 type:complete len:55 (+) comp39300_c0_seq5:566-730(+)
MSTEVCTGGLYQCPEIGTSQATTNAKSAQTFTQNLDLLGTLLSTYCPRNQPLPQ